MPGAGNKKDDNKREAHPAKRGPVTPMGGNGPGPTPKPGGDEKEEREVEEKREARPTAGGKEPAPTGGNKREVEEKREARPTDGEKEPAPTGPSGGKKKVEKREGEEEQDFENGESVTKRGNGGAIFIGDAPAGAKFEMGFFGVGALAVGIAALVM